MSQVFFSNFYFFLNDLFCFYHIAFIESAHTLVSKVKYLKLFAIGVTLFISEAGAAAADVDGPRRQRQREVFFFP